MPFIIHVHVKLGGPLRSNKIAVASVVGEYCAVPMPSCDGSKRIMVDLGHIKSFKLKFHVFFFSFLFFSP